MKNLKKSIVIALLMFSISIVNAQEESKREKMEAMKVAYITEKLELTEVESQNFWPVYNEYKKTKKEINKRDKDKQKIDINAMSDREVEAFINQNITRDKKMLDLKTSYLDRFKKVLPIKKVAKLLLAEKSFRREVLKRMKQNK